MNPFLTLLLSLAQAAAPAPASALVDVTVIDLEAGALREHQTLVVRGERIEALRPSAQPLAPEVCVLARGGFALPGLWDMHVHLTDATELALAVLVAHGVTGVRDMGGELARLDAWRAECEAGTRLGPRIVRCGPYLDGPKPGLPYRVTLSDADSARAALDELEGRVDFLKVHNGVPREAYFALATGARERGLAVCGHIPVGLTPLEAVRAGQRSLEHVSTFFEARFVEPRPSDPRAQLAAIERFVSEDQELLSALRAHGTWVTPNLIAVDTRARRAELAAHPDPRLRWTPASLRRQWDEYFPLRAEDSAAEVVAARTRFLELMLHWTQRLHEAGVPLLLGTDLALRDVYPGASVVDELRLLVRAGLSPLEALRCATLEPARCLRQSERFGTLAAGKAADVLVLGADPLADVGAVAEVRGVLLRGAWHGREELEAACAEAARLAPER
jgi:hypothetical protein